MDHSRTSAAGLRSSRGTPWIGTAAFAVGAIALASVVAAWLVGLDPTIWTPYSELPKTTTTVSFDDRFGSRSALDSRSMRYSSRSLASPGYRDFDAEFEQVEAGTAQPAGDNGAAAPPAVVIPLPRSRPVEANLQQRIDPPPAPVDNRSLLQKLADLVPGRFTLAALEPNGGLFSEGPDLAALGYDSVTAVYDISARAVYMPDRTRLEAHSGLGSLMDDPAHVAEPNVGATPPSTYDLKPRERLFHGVQALRMIPADGNNPFGRTGLLTHSYLLGPSGESNGCVSFKNYDKFLQAFQRGEVKRLVVVTALSERVSATPDVATIQR